MAVFHLRRTSDDHFYFVAYARYGPRLIQSGAYPTHDAANQAVESCRAVAPDDSRYERLESPRHKHYFHVSDATGAYLATSDVSDSPHWRDQTINYCRERLPSAGLDDETVAVAPP